MTTAAAAAATTLVTTTIIITRAAHCDCNLPSNKNYRFWCHVSATFARLDWIEWMSLIWQQQPLNQQFNHPGNSNSNGSRFSLADSQLKFRSSIFFFFLATAWVLNYQPCHNFQCAFAFEFVCCNWPAIQNWRLTIVGCSCIYCCCHRTHQQQLPPPPLLLHHPSIHLAFAFCLSTPVTGVSLSRFLFLSSSSTCCRVNDSSMCSRFVAASAAAVVAGNSCRTCKSWLLAKATSITSCQTNLPVSQVVCRGVGRDSQKRNVYTLLSFGDQSVGYSLGILSAFTQATL